MNAPYWQFTTTEIMARPDQESRSAFINKIASRNEREASSLHACVKDFEKRQAAGTLTPEELDRIVSDKRRKM